ncbi:hypothetical protein SADUNF_Sadunf02G0136300 [Salix dunnii]|uniref:Uncharacterized protein n=1 Tax=Salix dunnii TaxID=1413687 RepID=A0A835N844_9ROSI|nr:hypothetical protein SADUNF_Sadunf02G0136300 [Salix dunnii]
MGPVDQNHNESHSYNNLITNKSSSWLEVRLFYVRITPCVIESVPGHLTLRHLGRSISTPLEINGSKIPAADSASLNLRRDRLNKESSEVTYASMESVRVTCGVEFEVLDNKDIVLCGSLERIETTSWGNNGSVGRLENDAKTGWCLECCVATGVFERKSVFKFGVSAPVIEISPRKKASRYAILYAIPADEELDNRKRNGVISNGFVRQRKVQGGAVFYNVVKDQCIRLQKPKEMMDMIQMRKLETDTTQKTLYDVRDVEQIRQAWFAKCEFWWMAWNLYSNFVL